VRVSLAEAVPAVLLPLTAALAVIVPASTSAWVRLWVPVQMPTAPTARPTAGQVAPGAVTVTPVSGRLPVLVAVHVQVRTSPARGVPPGSLTALARLTPGAGAPTVSVTAASTVRPLAGSRMR
jgi:hypothetical protein